VALRGHVGQREAARLFPAVDAHLAGGCPECHEAAEEVETFLRSEPPR
jgi:hypothetical protein